jgi:hypothetical protein
VAFFPGGEPTTTYSIRIWSGLYANYLLVDQSVESPIIGEWNYITLDEPLSIDITQELWVGYHFTTQTGYPMGVDAGPAIDGYGNMINWDGNTWQTLLEINPDIDYNWNIQAHLETVYGESIVLGSPNSSQHNRKTNNREITGYNIFKSNEPTGDFELYATVDTTVFLDEDAELDVWHCYRITAIYESEVEYCESEMSEHACEAFWVDIPENVNDVFNLFPNPANDLVMVEHSHNINRLTIYNSSGHIQFNKEINRNTHQIDVSSLPNGIYLVRIETKQDSFSRKLAITR